MLESFAATEVSSRSLGLLRIFAALTIWVEFASPWVAHRMDDSAGTMLLAWVVLVAAWFVVFGFKTRWATAIMALAFAGLHLYYGVALGNAKLAAPVQEFQITVLLALTPCGRSLSVDRALAVRRAKRDGCGPPPERICWWQLELFIVQTATIYLWLGYEGCDPRWLSGELLERQILQWYGSDMFVVHPGFHRFAVVAAWTATIVEFGLVVGLLVRRLRPYAMWVALAFLFVHMLVFSTSYLGSYVFLMMMTMLIACLSPQRIHDLISLQGPR
ncbi:hypothetical protein ENSA5_62730 [Enhygromyxa salina]|uniref:HTTM domain-containing protein n=1 Tax=Enhygromyxa salina TaxID=215803 RepID=A0A2S9XCT2_9BACT|nr:HTTM domain-containing protein [Enhygromyxa salina]PRP90655.1 hypothetical protein ENSA5_62730 [Enhygromyxa salina]